MEEVATRTYVKEGCIFGYAPRGKRLDKYGEVKNPDYILDVLQRWVERYVKRRRGIRGPIKREVKMDYRTGIPTLIVRCRMIRDVPVEDREKLQEWLNKIPKDRVISWLGEYYVNG